MTPAPRSSPGSKLRLAIRDRSQPAAWGLVAVAVVAALAGGLFVVKGEAAGKAQADAAAREAARTTCVSPAASQAAGCPQPPAATSAAHVPPGPQHVRVPAAPKHAAAQPSAPRQASPPAAAARGEPAAAEQVLALINQARAQAGLPAYTLTSGLHRSATAHNALMAAGCGLSHQCAGEPAIGARETAAGVNWTAAGENIGDGGPVSASAASTARMALVLTQDMLNEKPPADGHRQNILSSTFRYVGIAVYRDSSGMVWLTQDFSN